VERIADAFVWPFRDRDGVRKVVVIGLILVIPVVGAINGLGWMLAALDRLRAGEETMPPANFGHLARGLGLFAVLVVYYLAAVVVAAVLYVPAVLILSSQSSGNPNAGLVTAGVGLSLVSYSFLTLMSLAIGFATPAIVLAYDRGGIAGGLSVKRVVRTAIASPVNTLIAGLMLIAAGIAGGLGIIVCFVGVFFTQAYQLAMQAWIIRSFELGTKEVTDGGRATA
jgi:hypothetical protein